MKSKKKAQIITLCLAVAVLTAGGIGFRFFTKDTEPERNQIPEDIPEMLSEESGAGQARQPDGIESGTETGTEAKTEVKTEVREVNDNFILLDGGKFLMGSPESERQREPDEAAHEVTISPFYVDPYEVTQGDYETLMGENPSYFSGDNLPVENVTWYEAIAYCNALSESRGLTPVYTVEGDTVSWNRSADGYRLLTEAEWEYAARAGTSTVFNAGDQITSEDANFEGSYPYLIEENYVNHRNPEVVTSSYRGETISVDSLEPNQFGLYNMYGNVSEWCFDYYGEYAPEQTDNPAGALSGSLRVNRGGSYIDFAKHLRSAYRSAANPIDTDRNLGFRIARNAQAGEGTVETVYSLDIQMPENPRILIAYFSYSGNTEHAAELIQQKTGADLVEIEMENPYSGNIYEVSQADLNRNIRPALRTHVENMEQYDVILLGYPTWWATMPMPVYSFVEEYDFDGKIIIPFSSHGGTMFGDSVSDLSKLVPDSYVGIGFEFNYSGGSSLSDEISEWLALSGIKE